MFVLKSTHDAALAAERRLTQAALESGHDAVRMANDYRYRYESLLSEWDELVDKINARGGEEFLNSEPQFTKEEIAVLIRLCHPDRHDGKESAVQITQRLLKMRK